MAHVVDSLVIPSPPPCSVWTFALEIELDRALALKANKGNFDAHMQLSQRPKADLHWWANNVTHCCKPISQGHPDVTLKSDASSSGWRGVFGSRLAGGRRTEDESEHHINYFELHAGFFTIIQSFCMEMMANHARFMIDNVTALAHVNNMGGAFDPFTVINLHGPFGCGADRNLRLSAAHIPGVCNIEADRKSRIFHDSTE